MAKIFKANQIKIDSEKSVFIPHHQKIPEPPKQMDPAEEAFTEEVFRELSPVHLAGSGEKLMTEKKEGEPEESQETREKPATTAAESPAEVEKAGEPRSQLSYAAKKARHSAALEAIKIKELELEALEEELRTWEQDLKDKERALSAKELELSQTVTARRNEAEAEARKSVETAKETAKSITEAAKAEAEAIKKAAQLEVESLRDKAYKEGFALGEEKGISAGEEQGLHEARLDWQNLMKESEMLINELQTSRIGVLKASEEEMLRLVISFAKSIIKVEPIAQPDIILKNIDQAINKIADADKIVMRINMKDKAMCQAHKEAFMSKLSSVSELKIIEDPTLTPGGIKIETGVGTIDATIESQASELEKALIERFRKTLNAT
ncbi:MAG: flagellar assembly protein FliH [Clostridiales bacterium]|jgi:flagellar assembly protein FliH|nr:flagellar assembly protein FliH [Clostridiales bacterium]MDN5283250.1 flagellar assembly protein FliH [Candidatus Ozemobacter sp.]